jgi:hypothetical protein
MPAAAPVPDIPVLNDKRPRATVADEPIPLLVLAKSDGVVTIILGLSNSKYRASPSFRVIKLVADGVPVPALVGRVVEVNAALPLIVGASIVGDVPKTNAPVPVSPATAAARFALVGVSKNVATFTAGVVVASVVSPRAVRCAAAAPVP